jgi:hypothetical protein
MALGNIIGTALGIVISEHISTKQLIAKGIAALMIGFFILPAFMPYFKLPMDVWLGINAVASVMGVEFILILITMLKHFLKQKTK